jgi:hypothetical protein
MQVKLPMSNNFFLLKNFDFDIKALICDNGGNRVRGLYF